MARKNQKTSRVDELLDDLLAEHQGGRHRLWNFGPLWL